MEFSMSGESWTFGCWSNPSTNPQKKTKFLFSWKNDSNPSLSVTEHAGIFFLFWTLSPEPKAFLFLLKTRKKKDLRETPQVVRTESAEPTILANCLLATRFLFSLRVCVRARVWMPIPALKSPPERDVTSSGVEGVKKGRNCRFGRSSSGLFRGGYTHKFERVTTGGWFFPSVPLLFFSGSTFIFPKG